MLSTQFYGNLPRTYTFAKNPEDKIKALDDALKTSDGRFTNGVFNMTKKLLRLIDETNPEYFGVCWDISRNTFRRQLYPSYKAHRKETPHQLSSQFGLMQEVLEQMGIPQFKLDNYEADDLLGTISKRFSGEYKVYIITKDRDALQLIDEHTTVWLDTKQSSKMLLEIEELDNESKYAPMGYFPFSLEAFRTIYGLEPIQLTDLKGMTGDTSDGIPGIEGIGEKTAIPLLQHFQTVENFYKETEILEVKAAKKYLKEHDIKRINPEKMMENKEIALLSKVLATIHTSVPGYESFSINSLQFELDRNRMIDIFEELEFYTILNEM